MQDKVEAILYKVMDIVNKQLKDEHRLKKSKDTILIGKESSLDSLGILNFITTTEELIEEEFKIEIALTEDEEFIFSENGPLRSIEALTVYISEMLT